MRNHRESGMPNPKVLKLNRINGTNEDDHLTGTALGDLLVGYDGNDLLEGNDGNDVLEGDDGNDVLDGGPGSDSVEGGDGDDVVRYFAEPDNDDTDTADGGDGHDVLEMYFPEHMLTDSVLDELQYYYKIFIPSVLNAQGIAKNKPFEFSFADLTVRGFEELRVVVDGKRLTIVETDPSGQPTVIDLGESTENERVEVLGDGDTEITTGSGDDIVIAGPGNDIIRTGDGDE